MENDEWRPAVPDWTDIPYEVSRSGQIRSTRTGQILTPHLAEGYLRVALSRHGQAVMRTVAPIVAMAFHGPRPPGHVVRHLDGDKTNVAADNLAWGTRSEGWTVEKRAEASRRTKVQKTSITDLLWA